MSNVNKPLKILMILHMPWNRNLGGARVQLELAEEFQLLGHQVEKFDILDAFPHSKFSRLTSLTRPSFATKARAYVEANAHRFDIIDAHQGNLPFSKGKLGFEGLLVARSVGLYAFCEEFASFEKTKWAIKPQGNPISRFLRNWRNKQESPYYLKSLEACDLINLPNFDELKYVKEQWGLEKKSVVFPFGLSEQRQQKFISVIPPSEIRLSHQEIVFIGYWSPRKGSRDWAEIIRRIKEKIPKAKFLFLGTGVDPAQVLADLEQPPCEWIKIVPSYDSEELPELLSTATVGAFPSYMEGFGFAVLEKLASGLPTIAYDIPGPRDMLSSLDTKLMVSVGSVEEFANRLIDILQLSPKSYSILSEQCVQKAKRFSWKEIARAHLEVYTELLQSIK
ncbi:glycosyltransferase [Desertifilum sp. FACHB-1129]|uniref:Glycosyl transferase family 1 domain-containing protein n=1 Tax=Desertifilum tharense IPPAS B-1220 TaxID=1781255 RepID=A0A1E5QNK9_9CYAN|nr:MULTISPECIES: glycosyltransferase [Desertifilum]MDA0208786.1 glycosyltransferase [Cyanobacteria bacterium FC1]MBD2310988.1 glycosyltransferase [Desertifilum sp. FACHB-1129]MBD2321393.1 glycosyltransferase [Desertifilum sp. FACHB-866]MBD2331300.1 glycosyltransferase [Desertifilum sp. FACHB-868]OEJ75933.1 hypothetical protein BH720_06535 [Desertifilum tharense IPPAS B-1220]